ncbi:HUL4 [Candida theae]|uniref:HECT-type E3 ubiquitin transferase n=1 Tax=Candida theae TaxID=1198502 RepID=A0AAD5FX29_9ASCO|nr:HUL4 [Candida theae]KAI5950487.1 HUL4 [Candida theae]
MANGNTEKASGAFKIPSWSLKGLWTSSTQTTAPPTPPTPPSPHPPPNKSIVNQDSKESHSAKPKNSKERGTATLAGSIPSSSYSRDSQVVNKCFCCDTILTFPNTATKYKCSICHTTNFVALRGGEDLDSHSSPGSISLQDVNRIAEKCFAYALSNEGKEKPLRDIFQQLSTYLYSGFKSHNILNDSFKKQQDIHRSRRHTASIDYSEIRDMFGLLSKLPTKRPLYSALKGASDQLKRISPPSSNATQYRWLFILLEIPVLSHALVPHQQPHARSMSGDHDVKTLCYDILKRSLGVLSCIDDSKVINYFTSWISHYNHDQFIHEVDLINLYITFQLKKYFYLANNPHIKLSSTSSPNIQEPDDLEYFQSANLKDHIESGPTSQDLPGFHQVPSPQHFNESNGNNKSKNGKDSKIRVQQYGNDWRIVSASKVLSLFLRANKMRDDKIPISVFYNSLVDYVNIKLDFDSWQSQKKLHTAHNCKEPELKAIIGYIHGTSVNSSLFDDALLYICQYPFLISLGSKISVLEYEARRQMERKAEEAFINSLDKRVVIDVYLRIKVRRDHIVQDSMKAIKSNLTNLKKSLKVQFINEPGVDAGGLRKEWFILLTKEIFHPQAGLFHNVEDSNLLWFNTFPLEDPEMYFLFGAVLGLAIYNSTILDLQFPVALYKILLGKSLHKGDYKQLYPESYKSLSQLKTMSSHQLKELELTFEVTLKDALGKVHTRELIVNGASVSVTKENVDDYISRYMKFFLREGIQPQLDPFVEGFNTVIAGNALSLFSEEEIELLLCGSDDHRIDVDVLQSITKYIGWPTTNDAANSNIIKWFWEYLAVLGNTQRKKLLVFVTGSDRVPATGIQNLPFKVSLLGHGLDSERLPIAHTCFNELAIYNYSSKAKMIEKLNKAINESSGFGIK